MSSWKENSEGGREPTVPGPAGPDSPAGLDPSLLEQVLERTLRGGESADPLDGATRAALVDFARKDGGRGELSEALLADLVGIVLRREMALLAARPIAKAVCDQVAELIWEDPAARGRLSNLWRLLEGQMT